MKYVYVGIGILLIILLICLICYLKKRHAMKCVCRRCKEEKIKDLNCVLEPFGYVYCEKQDIFISGYYIWQREMGYCRFYDESAVSMNMVFDCEPVPFYYDGREWLIEFWKGQYGMSTGGEVGLYVAKDEVDLPGIFSGTMYESVADEEMLPMEFVLKKNGRTLCKRSAVHWWLAGFLLGEYSSPKQLSMEIKITFPNREMRNAFLEGLYRLGYAKHEVCICNLTVTIYFTIPKSRQPRRKWGCLVWLAQWKNRRNCRIYRKLTKYFCTSLDRIDYLRCCYRRIYKLLLCVGRLGKKNRKLEKFKKRCQKQKCPCRNVCDRL
ncbi:MAG: DUF4474 domain-containing protein [Lachnospiraceae bacterium]|nr:DUF4474 domain-containing protein [Lachnospiraceae bacterium]